MFTNNISQFKVISIIKNGKYGIVYRGTELNTNKSIVIKKIPVDEQIEKIDMLCKEIYNCRQFKHPNIEFLIQSFIWKENIYLVYPFMCFGDCQTLLQQVFKSGKFNNFFLCIFIFLLSYLHTYSCSTKIHVNALSWHELIPKKNKGELNFPALCCC